MEDEPWQLTPGPEGTLFLLTRRNAAAADADSFAPWLLQLDGAGNVLQTRELPCPADPAWAEALFTWDDGGNVYLLDNGRILAAGPQGEDRGVLSENARFLFRGKDGRALAVIAPAYGDWRVRSIDPRTLEMKDVCTIPPAALSAWDVTFFPGSGAYDLYAVTDLSLYGYKLDGGSCSQLLTWANCDVEAAALLAVEAVDGGFFCVTGSTVFGGAAVRLTGTDTPPDPARTLTLACRGLDRDMALQVLRFNRKNLGWRIRIRDYGTADLVFRDLENRGQLMVGFRKVAARIDFAAQVMAEPGELRRLERGVIQLVFQLDAQGRGGAEGVEEVLPVLLGVGVAAAAIVGAYFITAQFGAVGGLAAGIPPSVEGRDILNHIGQQVAVIFAQVAIPFAFPPRRAIRRSIGLRLVSRNHLGALDLQQRGVDLKLLVHQMLQFHRGGLEDLQPLQLHRGDLLFEAL